MEQRPGEGLAGYCHQVYLDRGPYDDGRQLVSHILRFVVEAAGHGDDDYTSDTHTIDMLDGS
jgi:hypothetical protein